MGLGILKGLKKITGFLTGRNLAAVVVGLGAIFGVNFLQTSQEAIGYTQTAIAGLTGLFVTIPKFKKD